MNQTLAALLAGPILALGACHKPAAEEIAALEAPGESAAPTPTPSPTPTPDPTNYQFDNSVRAVATATDGTGKVYVAGRFLNFNGEAATRIVRLNPDGS